MQAILLLASRIFMAAVFLVAGLEKIVFYAAMVDKMNAAGVPDMLLPLVIILEVGGSIMLMLGGLTRLVAAIMALFCLATATLFHYELTQHAQAMMFFKNLALAGGFILLALNGPGRWSLDNKVFYKKSAAADSVV